MPPSTPGTPSSPPPANAPPPPTGSSSTGRSSSGRTVGVVAAVVVAAALVAVLFLTGVFPGLHTGGAGSSTSSGSGASGPAESTATTYANGVSGGPWTLAIASGIDSTTAETILTSTLSNGSCPLSGGTISSISIPAYSGPYSNGAAEAWLFEFESPGRTTTLLVVVQGGTAAEVGEALGTGCAVSPVGVPADAISSSTAAADATATANGTKFVQEFGSANATYLLLTGEHLGAPTSNWYIEFSACSTGNRTSFFADLNATTGGVSAEILEGPSPYAACSAGGRTPIGTALAIGDSNESPLFVGGTNATYTGSGCAAGHYCYVLVVESADQGLSPSDFSLEVKTATGAVDTSPQPGGFTFVDEINGTIEAQTASTSAGGSLSASTWTVGSGVQITSLFELIIDTGSTTSPAGTGLVATVVGVGSYSGTISVTLP